MDEINTVDEKLMRSLISHEGKRNKPYVDTEGKITIGIGYNLTDRGLPDEWIFAQVNEDIRVIMNYFYQLDWFTHLNNDRQVVILDMAYNIGIPKFMQFVKMIDYLNKGDYVNAALEMINSNWAKEVGDTRSSQLFKGMKTGIYDI